MLRILIVVLTVTTLVSAQSWTHIPGWLSHVSGSLTYIWGVNSRRDTFTCHRPCNGSNWQYIPGSALVQVDVDDADVWGVDGSDHIFTRPIDASGSWQQVPGQLIHVSASGNGYIWGVNRCNEIFKCKKPCTGSWIIVDGSLKQIDGGQNAVYGVNGADEIYTRPVDGSGSWRRIPGLLKHISASGTLDVYGVNSEDIISHCRKPCTNGNWQQISGHLSQCDAEANALFGVNSVHEFYRINIPL